MNGLTITEILLFLMALGGNGLLAAIFMRLGALNRGHDSLVASNAALWAAVNDMREKFMRRSMILSKTEQKQRGLSSLYDLAVANGAPAGLAKKWSNTALKKWADK